MDLLTRCESNNLKPVYGGKRKTEVFSRWCLCGALVTCEKTHRHKNVGHLQRLNVNVEQNAFIGTSSHVKTLLGQTG